ncbi:hypothetical protein EJ05DRAFT_471912 [Pseudovirgaria hyperparasitica]|uniref:Uncharacterized protein n=1 Tax=Pseudovirgaria hyperparasitica TaxID=470096 RepID=A0A6A6WLC1_9PEZI|nr:uncharacterized protein EJ05DRAFT_471912 [Pseudovirgaria hyperparasitica]KAF2762946.1 hypothetical protein EJ05DRAFT_471912 [Pseudovirgaria hyperparasitica]
MSYTKVPLMAEHNPTFHCPYSTFHTPHSTPPFSFHADHSHALHLGVLAPSLSSTLEDAR